MFKTVNKALDIITDSWLELGMTDSTTYKKAMALCVVLAPIVPITSIACIIAYSKALSKLKKLED